MIIPKEVKQKPFEYLLLVLVFLIGLIIYFFTPISSHGQRLVVYCMAGCYFIWSMLHHYRRGDLSFSIVVEYLVMALFGIVLLSVSLF